MMDLKVCPKCGNTTDAGNEECPYCGYRFKKLQSAIPSPASSSSLPGQKRPLPTRHHKESGSTFHKAHSPIVAALCSLLFIGWGQWYNGRTLQGVRFVGIFLLGALLFVLLELVIRVSTFAFALSFIFFLVMTGAWVFGIADAYTTGRQIMAGEAAYTGKSKMFWFPVIIFVIGIGLIMLFLLMDVVSGKGIEVPAFLK